MIRARTTIEKRVRLSVERAERLHRLAQAYGISEDQIIAKALDMLLNATELLDDQGEGQDWSVLPESSLQRVWDNLEDAAYDFRHRLVEAGLPGIIKVPVEDQADTDVASVEPLEY